MLNLVDGDNGRSVALVSVFAALALKAGAAAAGSHGAGIAAELTTDIGELHAVQLVKGVLVRLNSGTHIRLSDAGTMQNVEIVTGECMFELAPDAARSIEVTASSVVIRVDSGKFDVKRDAHYTSVAVTEGTAIVQQRESKPLLRLHANKPRRLEAGEELRFPEGAAVAQFRRIDAEERVRRASWTHGQLWFERARLSEVVAQLNKFNKRRLVIGDRELERVSISGLFRPTDLDSFLRALEPFGIHGAKSEPHSEQADVVLTSYVYRAQYQNQ